eukprot:3291839-Rhodomonas_salina.5
MKRLGKQPSSLSVHVTDPQSPEASPIGSLGNRSRRAALESPEGALVPTSPLRVAKRELRQWNRDQKYLGEPQVLSEEEMQIKLKVAIELWQARRAQTQQANPTLRWLHDARC